jgi:hypothetical protein
MKKEVGIDHKEESAAATGRKRERELAAAGNGC